VNCFFDWFLNRVALDQDMNVPLNFRTDMEWRTLFRQLHLRLVEQVRLGVDEPLAPEFHVMYVLDKAASEKSG
jgi:hypothetical protein